MGLRYEILKEKYERLYNKTLEENKEILIESFVEYYGEKYRDEIVSRFNEITFVYFIDWKRYSYSSFLQFKDYFLENSTSFSSLKQEMFQDLQGFLKYQKKTSDTIRDCFVGSSDEKILKKDMSNNELKNDLIKIFSNGTPACSCYLKENKIQRIICLPMFIFPSITIIHEINHALTYFPLFTLNSSVYIKVGFDTMKEENIFSELINECISFEILKIFKRREGNMSALHLAYNSSPYDRNLYLVKIFYKEFKKIIKESYITLNKNNLIERIGKDNYQWIVDIVNKYYADELHLSRKNKKETKKVRQKLVKKMQKKVKNIEELTKEDLEKFYRELEQEGKKVRILNKLPENAEENKNSYHI